MSKNIVSMPSQSNALEVAKKMLERKISSILLTDETDKIVGIITERDLLGRYAVKTFLVRGLMPSPLCPHLYLQLTRIRRSKTSAKLWWNIG